MTEAATDAGTDSGTAGSAIRRAFSVAVYARRGDRVLVIEHRRLRTWLPIGGELEPGETPLEAAVRELGEETGLGGRFRPLAGALDGVPAGLLGYEEHTAGSKGLHLNFVFVTEVAADAEVAPNHEFGAWRWVDRGELDALDSPLNVRQFGYLALDARFA
ncbi:MAG TPA: NUDIX domain-containing protein [Kofleriaceae bacterium]|nr:NUDIX domain-containing protein [Kofleriaceae bacterium]